MTVTLATTSWSPVKMERMAEPLRCYVASPLGFSAAGRLYYAKILLPALGTAVEVVDPWALVSSEELTEAARLGREHELAAEIGRRNSEAIRGSQLLVAVLDGQEIDSGTAAEVGYASAIGLTCFGLRTDLRKIGEPGATVNLQVEAFITHSGGEIVGSVDALLEALTALRQPASPAVVGL